MRGVCMLHECLHGQMPRRREAKRAKTGGAFLRPGARGRSHLLREGGGEPVEEIAVRDAARDAAQPVKVDLQPLAYLALDAEALAEGSDALSRGGRHREHLDNPRLRLRTGTASGRLRGRKEELNAWKEQRRLGSEEEG